MNVLVTGIQSVQDQILQRTVKLTARLGQLSKIITNSLNNPLIVAQENPVHIGGPSGDDEGPSCGDEHPSDVDPEKEYGGLIDKSDENRKLKTICHCLKLQQWDLSKEVEGKQSRVKVSGLTLLINNNFRYIDYVAIQAFVE
ncbi:hypothetical protein LguiA_022110 [Lonicera macranthoides]